MSCRTRTRISGCSQAMWLCGLPGVSGAFAKRFARCLLKVAGERTPAHVGAGSQLIDGAGFVQMFPQGIQQTIHGRILSGQSEFGGVTLPKTGLQLGFDTLYTIPELAKALGEIMGVVFEAEGQETTCVVGDTVWGDEVVPSLERFQPDVVVLNAGADIVAVHMDAVNHI